MNKIIISGVIIVALAALSFYMLDDNKKAEMAKMEAEKMEMEKKSIMEKDKMIAEDKMKMEESKIMDKKMDGSKIMDKTMEKDGAMMKKGAYLDYSADKLSMAMNGPLVLFFKASWCPKCIATDKDIMSKLSNIPENLTILKIDYDNSTELKKKYGVTSQHTFVKVDKNGNLISKWMGSNTLEDIVMKSK